MPKPPNPVDIVEAAAHRLAQTATTDLEAAVANWLHLTAETWSYDATEDRYPTRHWYQIRALDVANAVLAERQTQP